MRILLIGLVIVLLALSCVLAVRYNNHANYAWKELDNERYHRMVVEEGLQNANERISSLSLELSRAQEKVESTEAVLEEFRSINKDLKSRLDRSTRIQASLDKKIMDLQQLTSPL